MTAPAFRPDRAIAVFADTDKLRCPRGHPLPRNVWAPALAAVRCTWRSDPKGPMCGGIVLLLALTEGLRCVVEVSHVEAMHIEETRMSPAEAAHYLGLAWTPDRAHGVIR